MANRTPHLTDEELDVIQRALAARRRPGSYEPGRWSVSPYNRDPEVLRAALPPTYPESVTVRDITLRVIEQTPGVVLDHTQRLRLGEALLDAGVSDLEVSAHGWGISQDDLKDQIRRLKAVRSDLHIKMGATQREEMVDFAAEAGVTLAEFWLPSLPELTPIYWAEAYRAAWRGDDWRALGIPMSLDQELERARQLIARIQSHGLLASAGINLLTFVDDQHIRTYCEAVVAAGVSEIWLSDGSSGIAPEGWNHVIRLVRELAPRQRIGIYTRDIFGMGMANAIACVRAGADVIEASVNGVSCSAGQIDLAHLATALKVLYGVETGIRLERLTSLARLVEDITRVRLPDNHPVTGRNAHNWGGTEITTQELKVDPLIHWAYEPSLVGGTVDWIIDRTSGMWSLKDSLDKVGAEIPRSDYGRVYDAILREMAVRRRHLTHAEIGELALTVSEPRDADGIGPVPG